MRKWIKSYMKKQFIEIEKDGFYGTYYENPKGADDDSF